MTVENTSIVDAVGTDKDTGEVRLSIFDHLPWNTDHLRVLQDKINVYLGFIESGEIYVSYPNAKGRPLVIDVYTKFRPTEDATRFLKQAEAVTASHRERVRTDNGAVNNRQGAALSPRSSVHDTQRIAQVPLRSLS
ncbi:DUF6572 domain-containing protein [Variovorax paradoxus]|jgi:hypothetical protein|uniref:DUF6572 domain-containing protein n=1 Tax=Variovorax paradoxus TaxID=34073 RepID=UPI0029C8603D|nr:DUF6572 domain-containing protein [Variovorax paradoxus]WPH20819.1 DUF6572 domain-containing protein [Variovorax paradoxus]